MAKIPPPWGPVENQGQALFSVDAASLLQREQKDTSQRVLLGLAPDNQSLALCYLVVWMYP